MKLKIKRRTFLRGVGGTAVALPFLEVMDTPARAASDRPCRYVVMFAGIPIRTLNMVVPDQMGANWTAKRGLAPLRGLEGDTSIVSDLLVPWNTRRSAMEPGGRFLNFHGQCIPPLVSGTQGTDPSADSYGRTFPEDRSSDQIVADAFEGQTQLRSLEYCAQARAYRGGSMKSHVSAQRNARGEIEIRKPIQSPRLAFDSLFNHPSFGSADPKEQARLELQWKRRRSVLDNVRNASDRLDARLGVNDRRRLERHFDGIRDLERRLAAPPPGTAMCTKLPDPGNDPPAEITTSRQAGEDREIGYANEDWRADRLVDLMHMAFACDMTRSATLVITYFQSFMNARPLVGAGSDAHDVGHRVGSDDQFADLNAWHVGKFARLVQLLKDTDEGGQSMLDTSAVVFLNEAGWGYDPESKKESSAHSTQNMVALVGGHAGGLAAGRHIAGNKRHPGSVLRSAMKAVGVDEPLGQITEDVPELFTP